jgi:hypothetical protein
MSHPIERYRDSSAEPEWARLERLLAEIAADTQTPGGADASMV